MKKCFYYCLLLPMMFLSFLFLKDGSISYHTFESSISRSIYYAMPSEEDTITPCSDDIRWCYKMINGVLCRRQYNYTTNTWIGSWEPV